MVIASLGLIVVAMILLAFGLADGANGFLVASIAASLLSSMAIIVSARRMAARLGAAAGRGAQPDDVGLAVVDDLLRPAGDGSWESLGIAVAPGGDPAEPLAEAPFESPAETVAEVPAPRRGDRGAGIAVTVPTAAGAPWSRDHTEEVLDDPLTVALSVTFDEPLSTPSGGTLSGGTTVAAGSQWRCPPEMVGVIDDELGDEPPAQIVSLGDAARVARLSADVVVVDGRPRYHVATCAHLVGKEGEWLPVREALDLGFTPCGHCLPDSVLLGRAF